MRSLRGGWLDVLWSAVEPALCIGSLPLFILPLSWHNDDCGHGLLRKSKDTLGLHATIQSVLIEAYPGFAVLWPPSDYFFPSFHNVAPH